MNDDQIRRAWLDAAGTHLNGADNYRRKVEAMIADKERLVRRGTFAATLGFVTALLVAVALMVGAGVWYEGEVRGVWLGVNACFWLVFASVLAFNRVLTRSQLETLKELKGIEMRILDIQAHIARNDTRG